MNMGDNRDSCNFCEHIDVTCPLPQIKCSGGTASEIRRLGKGGRLKSQLALQLLSPGTFVAISASLIFFFFFLDHWVSQPMPPKSNSAQIAGASCQRSLRLWLRPHPRPAHLEKSFPPRGGARRSLRMRFGRACVPHRRPPLPEPALQTVASDSKPRPSRQGF